MRGPTRPPMTAPRRCWCSNSSTISRNSPITSTKASAGRPRRSPSPHRLTRSFRVLIHPEGPDMTTEYSPRLFAGDHDIRALGEGLLACSLPRAAWTHEAHLAACPWLLTERPDIDVDRKSVV